MERRMCPLGKYRKILVSLDGSESGRNALVQSFALARDEKCWLTAATVVPGVDGDLELVGLGDVRAALRKPGEAILAQARALAEAERVPLKTVLEEGEAWERIVHLADDERCDLIVMGRRGLRRLERVMMGSVTARVIGHTDRDVLVVPQGTALSFKRILVATDGSPTQRRGGRPRDQRRRVLRRRTRSPSRWSTCRTRPSRTRRRSPNSSSRKPKATSPRSRRKPTPPASPAPSPRSRDRSTRW